jgi:predicted DNA-binding WGR domain protein
MKFNAGDCISLKVDNSLFLAGFIYSVERGKYNIALGDYRDETPPVANYFSNCQLFAVKFEMGENSLSALDVMMIDPDYMDQSADIELVIHIEIPGFLSTAGYQEISNISEAKRYYETGINLRNDNIHTKDNPVTSFETKCLVSITEFFKNIDPRNEFPTIKLYKTIDANTHYWQIYGSSTNPEFLVIHWGRLGETGEHRHIKDWALTELKKMYDSEISGKRAEGYQEPEELQQMILQFQTTDQWGGEDDLEFRNEIWEYLDKFLYWTGNGSISSGDIGSGTVNLFFEVVTPNIAVDTIVQALHQKKIERPFLIALENNEKEIPVDRSLGIKVLYPIDYQGSFSY